MKYYRLYGSNGCIDIQYDNDVVGITQMLNESCQNNRPHVHVRDRVGGDTRIINASYVQMVVAINAEGGVL